MKIFPKAIALVSCGALVACSTAMPDMQNPPQTAQECAEYAKNNTRGAYASAPGGGLGANIFLAIASVSIVASAQASRENSCLESIGLGGQGTSPSRAVATSAQAQGLNLTPDEQNIWATLDDAQKARAVQFIKNGGTLIASLGDK